MLRFLKVIVKSVLSTSMSDRFSNSFFFGDNKINILVFLEYPALDPSKVEIFRNCGLFLMEMWIFFHFILLYCALIAITNNLKRPACKNYSSIFERLFFVGEIFP